MATLSELARLHTDLDKADGSHLPRLVGERGLLADLCFADLLLYVHVADGRWLVLGQVRPATNQTLYVADWIGTFATPAETPVLDGANEKGEAVEGEIVVDTGEGSARMLA